MLKFVLFFYLQFLFSIDWRSVHYDIYYILKVQYNEHGNSTKNIANILL